MKIYLIRHGRQCSKLCDVNVDLCEAGRRQAVLMAQRLLASKPEVVYSSDLLRAVQTAEEANQYWNVKHIIRQELREISFGEMEGLSDDVIAVRFRDFKEEQQKMTSDLAYPDGECAGDVIARAMPVLMELAESGYERVAVVTHGGVIRSLVAKLMEMDLAKVRLFGNSLENCSVTELVYDSRKKQFSLERFNDYAHLEPVPELLRSSWVDAEN